MIPTNIRLDCHPDGLYLIWLVWALDANGLIALRYISTTQDHANTARETCIREGCIDAKIEIVQTNHLYGQNDERRSAILRLRGPKG